MPMDSPYWEARHKERARVDLEEDYQLGRIGFLTYLWRLWRMP
jgi:hypothetical protein